MKTIQMTIDEELLKEVDRLVKKIGTTRSAFTREALNRMLIEFSKRSMEKKHIEGYKNNPVKNGEFADWEGEQVWLEL